MLGDAGDAAAEILLRPDCFEGWHTIHVLAGAVEQAGVTHLVVLMGVMAVEQVGAG